MTHVFIILTIFIVIILILIFFILKNRKYVYDLSDNRLCNYFEIYDIKTFMELIPYSKNKILIDQYLPKHIQIHEIPKKGWGLVTTKAFKKDDIIYKCPVVRSPENEIVVISKELGKKYISKDVHLGDIEIKHNLFSYYDLFLNHDNNSNTYHDIRFVIEDGETFIILKARKDINPGEELTINYLNENIYIFIIRSFVSYIISIITVL